MKLTTEELTNLGFRMLVLPPEKRNNRKAWQTPLIEAMNNALIQEPLELLLCLTLEEWNILRRAMRLSADGLTIRFFSVNSDEMLKEAVEQLRVMGLCYRDTHAWHVLPEVRVLLDAPDDVWQMMETAEQVYAASLGYLRVYGMMPARDLVRMVTPVLSDKPKPEGMDDGDFIVGIWRRRNGLADLMMAEEGLWLICPEAGDVDGLYAELREPKLTMKPYASYSVEEALAIGHGMPPGRCDAYDEVLSFYFSHGIEREAALDAIDHAVLLFQQSQLEDSIAALVQPLPTPPNPVQLQLLKLVFLRAPAWRLKGTCAEDLMAPGARVSKRTRMDDPCPCGSGKKYKHCCGRLQ